MQLPEPAFLQTCMYNLAYFDVVWCWHHYKFAICNLDLQFLCQWCRPHRDIRSLSFLMQSATVLAICLTCVAASRASYIFCPLQHAQIFWLKKSRISTECLPQTSFHGVYNCAVSSRLPYVHPINDGLLRYILVMSRNVYSGKIKIIVVGNVCTTK